MRRQRNKTSAMSLQAAERRLEAVKLRREGLTFDEIGHRLGVSQVMAHNYLKGEFAKLNAETRELIEAERAVELDRLDALHRSVWITIFPNGDNNPAPLDENQMKAVDKCLRVMERRAKLLGLDAPAKLNMASTNMEFTLTDLQEARKMIYGGDA